MSETDTQKPVAFTAVYGDRFRRQVEKGKANPLTGVKIQVGDTYLLGSEATVSGTYLAGTLQEALEMIENLEKGETCVLEFANGPTYLVLEPNNSQHVTLIGCLTYESAHDPGSRQSNERRAVVSKHAWVSELLQTTREFLREAWEVNPELQNSARLEELTRTVDGIDRQYR